MHHHLPAIRLTLLATLLLLARPGLAQEEVSISEDPFDISSPSATPPGEVQVGIGGTYERARRGRNRGTYGGEFKIEAGLAPNLELRFGGSGAYGRTAPRDEEERAPSWGGTTRLGLRWELAEERGPLPAFGLLGEVRTEYGESRPVYEFEAVALFGKTLIEGERPVSAYLNLGWTTRADPQPGERPGRYNLAAAVGQAITPDTVLVAAYIREQQERGERDSNLVQAGFRHRLGDSLPVLGVALGAGIGRDSPRWQVGVALQWTFGEAR
jgi:hypothetical protein